MKYKIPILLIFFYLFLSCNDNSKKENQHLKIENIDSVDFNVFVQVWNDAHLSKDSAKFSDLFDDSVLFYGLDLEKKSCIENKKNIFSKYPDFYQQIHGDIKVEYLNDLEVKCTFVKRVTFNLKTNDYPSYLVFRKIGNEWKIITEGDFVTDENLKKNNSKKNQIPKDAISGDFNGDGILEYMWLTKPNVDYENTECKNECNCFIVFSDSNIPSIEIKNCIGGIPVNEGDLNENKSDEIGLLPHWFTSCWASYYVWTFVDGTWIYAVTPFSTHCNQWDEGIKPIEIDYNKNGCVLIRYSEFVNEEIVTKTKSVKIVK
ncbi:nuclear transport factor 2 family protein [Flavobacterium sp. I3-2]|uniref:nuclear transport factor 2 family protein n=1 Tax=Flavobacterium sp. I3-2 TaxID=2748319 RepID=UPI0015A99309|nr:nuclear transport factor 2 family protein [Flavobacterium sp. I3-2]